MNYCAGHYGRCRNILAGYVPLRKVESSADEAEGW